MDQPLTIFYCDVCGQPISSVDQGYVIWKKDDDNKSRCFKIIHRQKCDRKEYPASSALRDFLGPRGLAILTAKLSRGPIRAHLGQSHYSDVADLDEFVDFMRRVQIPHYEEARRLFSREELIHWFADANEVAPYLPETLERIIREYGA